MNIYKQKIVCNGEIHMDVPYDYVDTTDKHKMKEADNAYTWQGADNFLLSVQKIVNNELPFEDFMTQLRQQVHYAYGACVNISYAKGDTRGFEYIMSEEELTNNGKKYCYILLLMEKDDSTFLITQRSMLEQKADNKDIMNHIMNSVGFEAQK